MIYSLTVLLLPCADFKTARVCTGSKKLFAINVIFVFLPVGAGLNKVKAI